MAVAPDFGGFGVVMVALPWNPRPATLSIERHLVAWVVTGLLCLGTVISSYVLIVRHLRHSGPKGICIYSVRILLMAPLYSVSSWVALVLKLTDLNLVLELCRKLYECIVIFAFTQLLVAQLGGFERLGHHLTADDCVHIFPLNRIVDRHSWTPSDRFVRRSLSAVLQYAAVSLSLIPVALLSALIPWNDRWIFHHVFGPGSTGVVGASQILAMYGLIVFYHANHVTLQPIRPVQKLISIKLLLIATIWQSMIVHGLVVFCHAIHVTSIFDQLAAHSESGWKPEQLVEGLLNGLIVIEMFILTMYHHLVFPPGENLALFFPVQHAGNAPPDVSLPGSAQVSVDSNAGTAMCVTTLPTSGGTFQSVSSPAAAEEGATGHSFYSVESIELSSEGSARSNNSDQRSGGRVCAAPGSTRQTRLGRWIGSDHWGRHVEGEQCQLRGCWHASCPTVRRFYHVFNITDIIAFYRELRRQYRTPSTDNLDASNAHRYAVGFFCGRPGEHAAALDQPLALLPS